MRLKNNIKELDEILKTAGQSGNIDLSDVQKHIEMLRRKTILEQHKYTVFFAKDGYWKTYVPDPDSKKGRRLIKRRDRDELDDAIVKEYARRTRSNVPWQHGTSTMPMTRSSAREWTRSRRRL